MIYDQVLLSGSRSISVAIRAPMLRFKNNSNSTDSIVSTVPGQTIEQGGQTKRIVVVASSLGSKTILALWQKASLSELRFKINSRSRPSNHCSGSKTILDTREEHK